MGSLNAGGVGRNRYSEPISGLTACVNAAAGTARQVLSTESPVLTLQQAGVVNAVAGGPWPPSRKL